MSSIFQTVAGNRVQHSKFDLSHEKKMTCNFNTLYPVLCQEVLPGDKFQIKTEHLIKVAPMIAPVMHRMNVTLHTFFVPNRLIWNEWESFITGGRLGDESPVHPYIAFQGNVGHEAYLASGQLADFLGLPTLDSGTIQHTFNVSSLPFRAYQLIYNEYYRDQNLEAPIDINLSSGQEPLIAELVKFRTRCWEKDYFTSALPWSQRGGEAYLPLGATAPVTGTINSFFDETQASIINLGGSGTTTNAEFTGNILKDTAGNIARLQSTAVTSTPFLETDLSAATSVTVEKIRKAVRLQEWLERSARGGARYIEQILSHFNVKSSDARLQRPEFLGGSVNPIVVSEVLNNTSSVDEALIEPLGSMAGHGISVGSTQNINKYSEEHGFLMTIMSIKPKTAYQQGMPKLFNRFDKFDYYWPEFAQLGEQEVKNKELYFDFTTNLANDQTFGYQSRYAEYKYQPSTVHGEFKTNLDFWHLGRKFTTTPVLNEDFVKASASNRIFAVETETDSKFYCQLYHQISAIRPIPYQNIPTI